MKLLRPSRKDERGIVLVMTAVLVGVVATLLLMILAPLVHLLIAPFL